MEKKSRELVMAKLYFKNKDYKLAERSFVEYVSMSPNDVTALKLLAQVYEQIKRFDKAYEMYERCYLAEPERTGVLLDICRILLMNEIRLEHVDYNRWLNMAIKAFPSNPIVVNFKAFLSTSPSEEVLPRETPKVSNDDPTSKIIERLISIEKRLGDIEHKIDNLSLTQTQPIKSDQSIAQPVEPKQPILSIEPKQPMFQSLEPKQPVVQSLEPKQPVVQSFEPKQPVAQSFELKQPEAQSFELKQPEAQSFELKQPEAQSFELKQPVAQSFELKQPVTQSFGSKQPVAQSFEPKQLFSSPLTQPIFQPIVPKSPAESKTPVSSWPPAQPLFGSLDLRQSLFNSFEPKQPIVPEQPVEAKQPVQPNPPVEAKQPVEPNLPVEAKQPMFLFGSLTSPPNTNLFADAMKKLNIPADGAWTFKKSDEANQDGEQDGDQENEEEAGTEAEPQAEPEENTCDMEPVVLKTGEEDEDILFEYRCKLHRFKDKEFRERGLGSIKVLRHKTTGKGRLIMRREAIGLVCLNCWDLKKIERVRDTQIRFIAIDASDGEPTANVFLVRFKTPELTDTFMSHLNALFNDDIELIDPKLDSKLVDKARTLQLPDLFYHKLKNQEACSGCDGCEKDD